MLQYLIKFSISLAVLYIFYRAVLRPLTFYQCNRFYLLCYSLLSFIIPFINITPWVTKEAETSNQFINIIPAISTYTITTNAGKTEVAQTSFLQSITLNQWLIVFISLGAIFMVMRIVYQYLSLTRIRKQSILLNSNDNVHLYQTNAPVSPFSFGNAIYFNSNLHTEEELQRIIQHEFVHVKQKHSIDILIGELLCVVNWFNPFAWAIRHAIRQNLEFIADDDVLLNGLDKKEYQYLLLKVVGIPQYSIANNFNFSNLKKRIAMMNKMKSARAHLTKFLFVLPLLAVLLLAFRNNKEEKAKQNTLKSISANDTIPPPPAPGVPPPPVPSVDLPEPTPLSAPPALPANVTGISISSNIDLKKGTKERIALVKLKNGIEEKYDLNNPKEKAAYIKKYGEISEAVPPVEPAAPVPLVTPAPPSVLAPPVKLLPGTNSANVQGTSIHHETNLEKGISIYTVEITLKNGTKEKYDLNDPQQKANYIKKYGQLNETQNAQEILSKLHPDNTTITDLLKKIEVSRNPADPNRIGTVIVTLNNGKKESYNYSDAKDKAAYIKKYGELLEPLPPAEPMPSVDAPDVSVSKVPLNTDASLYRQPDNVIAGNIQIKSSNTAFNSVMIIIDGIAMPPGYDINSLNTNDIASIQILKDKEITKDRNIIGIYGERARNGIIMITSKHAIIAKRQNVNYSAANDEDVVIMPNLNLNGMLKGDGQQSIAEGDLSFSSISAEMPLVLYNGKIIEDVIGFKLVKSKFSMLMLKPKKATAKYGDKAKYGALEITNLDNDQMSNDQKK
jgi:beta-lactamase regulating signal transducer with metallopeptidase domain